LAQLGLGFRHCPAIRHGAVSFLVMIVIIVTSAY
jgi:DMSO/TMAO reductase YedYZ heme-binding membrane subunit